MSVRRPPRAGPTGPTPPAGRSGGRAAGRLVAGRLVAAVAAAAAVLGACGPPGVVREPPPVAPRGPALVAGTAVAESAVPGPPAARRQRSVDATCRPPAVALGGGARTGLADGRAPNPSLRLVGSTAAGSGRWRAVVATGGIDQSGSVVSASVVCATATAAPVVVAASGPGPSAAASDALETVTCPPGTVPVGGGAGVGVAGGRPGPPQYFVTGTFPSTPGGVPAATGDVPASWTAIGALGGAGLRGATLRAVVVCLRASPDQVTVVVATSLGPAAPSSAREVTAVCPARSALVGGGGYTGSSELERPLQGLHLRGSFPATADGAPARAGAVPTAWSVVANSGGMLTVGARTSAFALCATT